MKGRSNRPQSFDPPPDEWVDGSWTVDCICGVTFDDGEEMVKCDECDVWVHTRCSRYVKGDDMFACDKCKNKNNRAGMENNPEETEVARLLVELPTKTISLERRNNNRSNSLSSARAGSCSRRPFKLWTDIPMEERVHVQGIPGGDPSLFAGKAVSSIFGPQLWKCTGYVPKKFSFQYREFPSWYENDDKGVQENDNDIKDKDNGAGVLLSLSKETNNVLATSPVAALVDMRSSQGKKGFKESGMGKFGRDHMPRVHNAVKKERTLIRPFVQSSKRRKDEFSKDRSGKKKRVKTSEREEVDLKRRTSDREDVEPKRRTSDREDVDPKRRTSDREDVDSKRRTPHSSKAVFTPTSDAKQLAFYGDRGPKVFKDGIRSIKNKNSKDTVVRDHISNDSFAVGTIMEVSNNNLTTTEESSEALYPKKSRRSHSAGDILAEEKTGHKVLEMSSKTDDAVTSVLKHTYLENASAKKKGGDCLEANNVDDTLVVRSAASPQPEDHSGSAPEHMEKQISQDIDCNQHPSSGQCKVKGMIGEDDGDKFKLPDFHSSPISDLKNNGQPSDATSDIDKVNDGAVLSLPLCENKAVNVGIPSEVVPDNHTTELNDLPANLCLGKVEGSEGSLEPHKRFSESKDGSDSVKNASKSEALECPSKMLVSVGKSSPTSSTMNSSKSLSHDFKSEDAEIANPFTKHGAKADRSIHLKSESCKNDTAMDEVPRKYVRERPKSSLNSNSKGLHSSRSTQNSISKQVNPDARDSVHSSSSKPSPGHQIPSVFGSSETNASMHHKKESQVQNKISSSVPQKVEKLNQTNAHPSSKLNQSHTPSLNPSPTLNSSMLSDEELALLLHQELNSSPRVPRVPRARQTGSLPQLTSTSATNMLMKRASVGGKDNHLVSKRKYKDATRDGFCSSRDHEDETKKIEKEKGQSSDQRKQDMARVEDAFVKEEGGRACVTATNSITSNIVSTTSSIGNGRSPSPREDRNLSSMRSSPRNISDDDTATAGRPVHHTLPGLINNIMSKGKRMTYEELCNVVEPHWPNLRKHNGERYAYASHSQAVLDCLRNRHEWARLVDRGPKTNTNRKRRSKLDTEESDDNGYEKGKTAKETEGKNFELQKEEFPKGKRKARKRRRLALQGRAVKDVRRRQKADSLTGDDAGPFSNTSEESMFSEDEVQVDRIRPSGSTSDDAGSA
ncbi:uncharacterized protein LOC123899401 isoform X1 [Trifolium pratense]|uniref:uncharacterized protein LOC123899401 isoform X1 n=1 Tax=Trifolium pratense TaxID=57577 RepID=UPI001E697BFE|nr:uncharacterized protein LOC123899401 isoform X1 [Trifolium pratense]